MSRPGISKLSLPPKEYDPQYRTTCPDGVIEFETVEKACSEDEHRIEQLQKTARDHPDIVDPDSALKLAKKLKKALREDEPTPTSASSFYMRDMRRRIVGALWALQDDPRHAPVTTAHILPTGWIIPANDLMLIEPRKLLERLRKDLNDTGAANADGFLFAGLHGEYNPDDGCFHLHVHSLVSKGMIDVVGGLRNLENERLQKLSNDNLKRPPVRKRKPPLHNLPEPISYCCQSYWPVKTFQDAGTGKGKRGPRHRIPEPYHSLYLIWLDHWRLEQLMLLMKLGVSSGKLKVSE